MLLASVVAAVWLPLGARVSLLLGVMLGARVSLGAALVAQESVISLALCNMTDYSILTASVKCIICLRHISLYYQKQHFTSLIKLWFV